MARLRRSSPSAAPTVASVAAMCAASLVPVGVLGSPTGDAARGPLGERVTVVPLEVDAAVGARLDAGTAALIEDLIVREVGATSGACVVTPGDLRRLGTQPLRAGPICGLDAVRALRTPYVVVARLGFESGSWRLEIALVERVTSRVPAKDTLAGVDPAAVVRPIPELVTALVETVGREPRPEARLLGVVAEAELAGAHPPCVEAGLHAIDAEAHVRWAPSVEWFVRRYGAEPVERVRRETALALAREAALREALGGGLVWVLAQLDDASRAAIHGASDSFTRWSSALLAGGKRFVRHEEVIGRDVDRPGRAATLRLRACVETGAIAAEVARVVANPALLEDPEG